VTATRATGQRFCRAADPRAHPLRSRDQNLYRRSEDRMAGIGPMELIIVAIIALLVLGPKRLPDAGRSIGKGMREFKGALTGDDDKPAIEKPAEA
jgi:sec-independent protein translocase protein TatA